MVKINIFSIIAIMAIALVAMTGTAYATIPIMATADGLTVQVDTIQTNGVYHGTPIMNSILTGQTTYEYKLVTDGTYTVSGTVINDNQTLTYDVKIKASPYKEEKQKMPAGIVISAKNPYRPQFTQVTARNGTRAQFSITLAAPSDNDIFVYAHAFAIDSEMGYPVIVDMGNVDHITAAETTHTVNQGPMSNGVALYVNGKFNFGNSTLYSFAA